MPVAAGGAFRSLQLTKYGAGLQYSVSQLRHLTYKLQHQRCDPMPLLGMNLQHKCEAVTLPSSLPAVPLRCRMCHSCYDCKNVASEIVIVSMGIASIAPVAGNGVFSGNGVCLCKPFGRAGSLRLGC